MAKGGDDNSCSNYVMDSAWGNDPIVAEMAIKPSVVEKIGSLFGDLITVKVHRAEQFVKRLARGGMVAM